MNLSVHGGFLYAFEFRYSAEMVLRSQLPNHPVTPITIIPQPISEIP